MRIDEALGKPDNWGKSSLVIPIKIHTKKKSLFVDSFILQLDIYFAEIIQRGKGVWEGDFKQSWSVQCYLGH